VTGNRNVGQTLTATPGAWLPVETAFTYQWLRSGHPILGATTSTYDLDVADYGKKIDVRVTGSAPSYLTSSYSTATSAPIAHPLLDAAPTPIINGDPTYQQTLAVDVGDWDPDGVAFTYRWRINGTAVSGATSPTFIIPASAVGKQITVTVTGSLANFASAARTSDPTAAVASIPFVAAGIPTVTGIAAVGKTLTAHPGTWSPTATFTYRWYRDGVPINNATHSTYIVTSASLGTTLTVAVTAKRAGYTTATLPSAGTPIP
jgi:hypothetical protein